VLGSAFVEGALNDTNVPLTNEITPSLEDNFAYTPEDEAAISQRLKDLGYL
jgi:hypothetical protein